MDLFAFCLNHCGTHTGSYPENFAKIRLDLAEIYRIKKNYFFVGWFVWVFIDLFIWCFNHHGTPTESFSENSMKIVLDLAEILRISKLDWHDGGEKREEKGRREGILLCNGLITL